MGEYRFNVKIYQIVGENIKKFREEAHMSIADLSKKTNIPIAKIKLMEDKNGEYKISIKELYQISLALKVNIKEFFPQL